MASSGMHASAVILILVALGSNGAELPETRPRCTAHIRGKLWPEGVTRPKLEPLEICSQKAWVYQWKPLTIDVSEWTKKGQHNRRQRTATVRERALTLDSAK